MKILNKHIAEKIREIIESNNFLLIEIAERGNSNNPVFEIFIDGIEPVSTESCAKINREICELLDADEYVSQKYRLDVSSPGIDRSLKYLEQFPKNIGREFEIKYKKNDQSLKMKAKLKSVTGDELTFLVNDEEVLIKHSEISSAKVLITF